MIQKGLGINKDIYSTLKRKIRQNDSMESIFSSIIDEETNTKRKRLLKRYEAIQKVISRSMDFYND